MIRQNFMIDIYAVKIDSRVPVRYHFNEDLVLYKKKQQRIKW